MTKKLLIGLHGKPRVGKDTVAKHLIEKHGLVRYGPSVRVKLTTAAMFDFPAEYLDDDSMKDQMDPYWGMTYRQMAQKVGKESSRDVFGNDIWMRHVEKKLLSMEKSVCVCNHSQDVHTTVGQGISSACDKCSCLNFNAASQPVGIILADVRYESEIEWIKAHGGEVMYIIRDNAPQTSDQGHVVDQGLPIELANYIIYNNTTIACMLEQADGLFRYTRDNQLKTP